MEDLFRDWKTNCENMEFENWFDIEFEEALKDLRPDASTGFGPMARYGADIKTALKWDPMEGFDPERVETLKGFVRLRLSEPSSPDPILVFIKSEPHKIKKLQEGRARLISAVGLVDTMTDRVMFGWLARKVLSTLGKNPVMIGWSPYQGGFRWLAHLFAGSEVMCIDKSGWDWTVSDWMLWLVRDLLHRLAIDAPSWWHKWLDERWAALFRDAVFGFRSGLRVKQPGWGVMKSGCYLTILINSILQCVLHYIVCLRLGEEPDWRLFKTMGDDTVQKLVRDIVRYLEEMRKLGPLVKDCSVQEDIEFCGHVFNVKGCVPAYVGKHIHYLRTCHPKVLPLVLESYQMAYALDERMWTWLSKNLARVAPARYRRRLECLRQVLGN